MLFPIINEYKTPCPEKKSSSKKYFGQNNSYRIILIKNRSMFSW